jgi:hypothetical protein
MVMLVEPTRPAARPFRCPLVTDCANFGNRLCILLMLSLPVGNWLRLIVWLLIGLMGFYLAMANNVARSVKSLRNETAGTP